MTPYSSSSQVDVSSLDILQFTFDFSNHLSEQNYKNKTHPLSFFHGKYVDRTEEWGGEICLHHIVKFLLYGTDISVHLDEHFLLSIKQKS